MFDKSNSLFPSKENLIYINHCGIAPMAGPAFKAEIEFAECHSKRGILLFKEYSNIKARWREALAKIFSCQTSNLSIHRNSAEPLCQIANGFNFQAGDEVISYCHEYPSNHYAWRLQERRGVKLQLLTDVDPIGGLPSNKPRAFSLDELEKQITPRTKIIALSHVQFCSGFAVALEPLVALCKSKNVDLVLDVAQSAGALEIQPEKLGISAMVGSGWKWLLGPIGIGYMYTSPSFREKIGDVLVGPDMMKQDDNYLNYTWQPFPDARRFEYSTLSYPLVAAFEASLRQVFCAYSSKEINTEILRLQDVFLKNLRSTKFQPILFAPENRSGILSLHYAGDPGAIQKALEAKNIISSVRGGYLRIAPHFYNNDQQMEQVAELLNAIG